MPRTPRAGAGARIPRLAELPGTFGKTPTDLLSRMRRPPDRHRDRGAPTRTRSANRKASARLRRSTGPTAGSAVVAAVSEGGLMQSTDKTAVALRPCLNYGKRSGFMGVRETKMDRGRKSAAKVPGSAGTDAETRQKESTAFQAGACKPHSTECAKRLRPTSR